MSIRSLLLLIAAFLGLDLNGTTGSTASCGGRCAPGTSTDRSSDAPLTAPCSHPDVA